jgi:hypothetical protein
MAMFNMKFFAMVDDRSANGHLLARFLCRQSQSSITRHCSWADFRQRSLLVTNRNSKPLLLSPEYSLICSCLEKAMRLTSDDLSPRVESAPC